MKNKLFILASILIYYANVNAQSCSNLFFSEYLEGSSNNKAIEIYNPTNGVIDLTDYKIYRYNNGSPTPSDSLLPQGTIAGGATFVAGNPSAIAAILSASDTLHTFTFFNGDDAMSLYQISTQTTLDIIGIIGNDPGVNWPVSTGATSELTLVRKIGVNQGNTNWALAATEWDAHPQNTTTFIGSHSIIPCCVATSSSISESSCVSYIAPSGNYVYTSSGVYNDTIPNFAGCDSVITINLTINQPSSGTDVISSCNAITWIDGNTYSTNNNTSTFVLTNAAGCDSTVTLNYTRLSATTGTDVQTSCNAFTWIDGNTYSASNNTATFVLTNAAGCDSTVTLNLTINPSPIITSNSGNVTACGDVSASFGIVSAGTNTYQWYYFNFVNSTDSTMISGLYTETNFTTDTMTIDSLITGEWNNYAVYCEVTNQFGCSSYSTNDSIITHELPIVALTLTSVDTLCSNDAVVALSGESPMGGTWSGTGVSTNNFDPSTALLSWNFITYSYTDLNNCTNNAMDSIFVSGCVGLKSEINNPISDIKILPNPNNGTFTIKTTKEGNFNIINELGQTIQSIKTTGFNNYSVSITELSSGIYFVVGTDNSSRQKIVVQK